MSTSITRYAAAHFHGVDALWREVFPDDPLDGECVVGSVMGGYDGHRGWIYALAVKPSHRRRGIASALMHAIERRLAAAGCGKLNLQVRASNSAVIAFYEALGFAVEARVSMGKRLDGSGP
jgi:ribosomal protein S18 acetylase RimI-like enzyme